MKVMVLIRTDEKAEAGMMPPQQLIDDMGRYNQELIEAGVLLAAEGLLPSALGKRVVFDGGTTTVVDGPFTESKELIAGFWLWQVASMEEAVAWVKRCPSPKGPEYEGQVGILEIRQVFEFDEQG